MEVTKKVPSLRFPGFEGEWEEKEFLDVFDSISTKKFQIKTSENKEFGLYEVVDQGQSPISGYSDESSKLFKQTPVILYGDHTTILKFRTTPFIVGADGVKLLKETSQKNDLKFLYHCLCFNNVNPEGYKRHFSILKTKSLNIAPSFPEQQKIADCLTAMDDTIEAQQQKVEQLQTYKKGLLQQLFSQTLRFPEFEGAWEVCSMEKISEIKKGFTPRTDNDVYWKNGDIPWLSIADMNQGKFVKNSAKNITKEALGTKALVPKGTLIMSFKLSIGKLAILSEKMMTNEAICHFYWKNDDIITDYIYYYLNTVDISSFGGRAVKGVTLNSDALNSIVVKLPAYSEQQKIADCLSTLDEVIELEQQKLEKLQVYKKGLLQQLFV